MKSELKVGYICIENLTKFAVVITAIDDKLDNIHCMFVDGSVSIHPMKVFEDEYTFTGNTCQKELLDVIARVMEIEK